jgi:hypothetical protein
MAAREERLSQSPTGTGGLVRGPIQTGRMKINLVSGEPGALHLLAFDYFTNLEIFVSYASLWKPWLPLTARVGKYHSKLASQETGYTNSKGNHISFLKT